MLTTMNEYVYKIKDDKLFIKMFIPEDNSSYMHCLRKSYGYYYEDFSAHCNFGEAIINLDEEEKENIGSWIEGNKVRRFYETNYDDVTCKYINTNYITLEFRTENGCLLKVHFEEVGNYNDYYFRAHKIYK